MKKSGKKKLAKKKTSSKKVTKNKRNTGRRYSPSEKKKILKASKSKSKEELHEIYGVTHETVRRWELREQANQKDNTEENAGSYAGTHPNWEKVLKIWKSRPGLGPLQICNQMKRDKIRINVATVRLIMEENGYTPPKAVIKEAESRRYEAVRPLELAHMDFKHFYINKQKVYLLLIQDDYSRFIMGHNLGESENMEDVTSVFETAINRHGKMQILMTDGGSAFYCWNGINKFQRLVGEEYGVDHIKAGSPRSNGKIESVNKQIEKELLRVKMFADLEETGQAIKEWIEFYNFKRTHMGLPQGMVPADRFLPGWNKNYEGYPDKTMLEQLKDVPHYGSQNSIWMEILRLAVKRLG